jgi:hypothetical protein
MSATSGATNEYSRGSGGSGLDSGGSSGGSGPPLQARTDEREPRARGLILAGTLLAALLLLVAEFTALYKVHLATSSTPIKTVTGGSNHSYAILVIALAAVALGVLVWRSGSRSALLALGVLGLVALLIAVLGDLPDSEASGLAGSPTRGYINASSTPSAGLYMETLGAILLIATCGLGFLTLAPQRSRSSRTPGRSGGPGGSRGPGSREPGGSHEGGGSSGSGSGSPRARPQGGDGGGLWSRGRRGGSGPGA